MKKKNSPIQQKQINEALESFSQTALWYDGIKDDKRRRIRKITWMLYTKHKGEREIWQAALPSDCQPAINSIYYLMSNRSEDWNTFYRLIWSRSINHLTSSVGGSFVRQHVNDEKLLIAILINKVLSSTRKSFCFSIPSSFNVTKVLITRFNLSSRKFSVNH